MKHFDTIFFTAHPDDAFIGAAGIILKMKDKGHDVLVVTASDGEYPEENSSIRVEEFQKSIDGYGISGHRLHFKDGYLQFHLEELCFSILHLLKEFNPSLIITHNRNDHHSDHRAVSEAVSFAVELMFHSLKEGCNLKLALSFPPISIGIDALKHFDIQRYCDISNHIEEKYQVVRYHSSQMPYIERNLQKQIALNRLLGSFFSCEYAEGFSVVYESKSISLDSFISSL